MILNKFYFLIKALKMQKKDRDFINKFKFKKLKKMLIYSYHNIPYYNKIFKKNNFDPYSFKSFNDIKKIPLLKKKDILDNYNLIQNKNIKSVITKSTSGSSGFPLKINYDNYAFNFSEAIYFRSMINSGIKPFEKGAYFWAKPFPIKNFYNYNIINKKFIWTMLDTKKQINLLKINKFDYWYIFPSILKLISREYNLFNYSFYPKKIISTGEVLDINLKKKFENIFNCKIFDHYGTQEMNRMASSCNYNDSLHMDEDAVFFEFDKNNEEVNKGEKGEIILTSLFNFRMPLIRYKVGDFGFLDTNQNCLCNNNFKLIKKIEGRADDIIILKNKTISPRAITGIFDNKFLFTYKIHSYKLIQKTKDFFILYIVKGNNFNLTTESEIIFFLKKILSKKIDVKIIYKKKILRNLGGKHRYIKSEIY